MIKIVLEGNTFNPPPDALLFDALTTRQIEQIQELCNDGPYGSNLFFSQFEALSFCKKNDCFDGSILKFSTKGDVIGFLLFRCVFLECEIIHVVVDKNFRKRGLGNDIFEVFFEELRKINIKKIFLEVGIENKNALNLYRKLEFQVCGTRKKYYRNSEDAIVMEKIL